MEGLDRINGHSDGVDDAVVKMKILNISLQIHSIRKQANKQTEGILVTTRL